MRFIVPIVEGHGDVEAVPPLLHRIVATIEHQDFLKVNPPIRVKSGSFLNDNDYFYKQITLAAAKASQEQNAVVLILLDCEDACPAVLGPDLLARAKKVHTSVNIFVALAYREFETWFLASVTSLGGLRGIATGITPPPDIERIRDAKGWLGNEMEAGYDPVIHQLEFTRKFDLAQGRVSPSFNRLYEFVTALMN